MIELQRRGISAAGKAPIPFSYKGQNTGEYFADLLVEGSLVLELKCVDRIANGHMAQCLNYLKASGLPLCLLVNFHSSKAEWKRVINYSQALPFSQSKVHWGGDGLFNCRQVGFAVRRGVL